MSQSPMNSMTADINVLRPNSQEEQDAAETLVKLFDSSSPQAESPRSRKDSLLVPTFTAVNTPRKTRNSPKDEGDNEKNDHTLVKTKVEVPELKGLSMNQGNEAVATTTESEDEDDKADLAEIAAEVLFHNSRITRWLEVRDKPDAPTVAQYQRTFVHNYCKAQKDAGFPKSFNCSVPLLPGNMETCESYQEYGSISLARSSVSQFFGHNKLEWLQIPDKYKVFLCRKHYQTISYMNKKAKDRARASIESDAKPDDTPEKKLEKDGKIAGKRAVKECDSGPIRDGRTTQLQIIRAQIAKMHEWRHSHAVEAKFTIQLTGAMQQRLARYHKLVSQGKDLVSAAAEADRDEYEGSGSRSKHKQKLKTKSDEKTPVLFAIDLDNRFGGSSKSVEQLLELVQFLEDQLKAGVIGSLPAVEFLLKSRPEDRARQMASAERKKKAYKAQYLEMPEELKAKSRTAKPTTAEDDGKGENEVDYDDDGEDEAQESGEKADGKGPVADETKKADEAFVMADDSKEADGDVPMMDEGQEHITRPAKRKRDDEEDDQIPEANKKTRPDFRRRSI